jgi:predicted nuclease of predicted toxin-antitoxin system
MVACTRPRATHLREENLQRMTDQDVFRKAAIESRILLTFDLDFGEILALSPECKASVVIFRLRNTHTPHVIERLNVTLEETKEMLESGSIVVVEERRLRARRLPLRE